MKIWVPWINAFGAFCCFLGLLESLSLLSVPTAHHLFGNVVGGLCTLASALFTIRAQRFAILLRHSDIVVRGLFRTRRFALTNIATVEVGEEYSPFLRLYVVLGLRDGKRVNCSEVFLWSFRDRSRHKVESWVSAIQGRLPSSP